mmetsp:Transcript_42549/g.76446  ORF Transcript_42549/g.76446 Transcript_42549/m.76446 type:complete len:277 (+) Transcript_42549:52-882(+)
MPTRKRVYRKKSLLKNRSEEAFGSASEDEAPMPMTQRVYTKKLLLKNRPGYLDAEEIQEMQRALRAKPISEIDFLCQARSKSRRTRTVGKVEASPAIKAIAATDLQNLADLEMAVVTESVLSILSKQSPLSQKRVALARDGQQMHAPGPLGYWRSEASQLRADAPEFIPGQRPAEFVQLEAAKSSKPAEAKGKAGADEECPARELSPADMSSADQSSAARGRPGPKGHRVRLNLLHLIMLAFLVCFWRVFSRVSSRRNTDQAANQAFVTQARYILP